jgi:plasmid stability protein
MTGVKQLLLRVPADVHRRLAARAAREGRSVNAVATELLDLTAELDQGDRQSRLRAAAAASGMLRSAQAGELSAARRRQIIESTRGLGTIADSLIADERSRP